jgi:hypothetical protein
VRFSESFVMVNIQLRVFSSVVLDFSLPAPFASAITDWSGSLIPDKFPFASASAAWSGSVSPDMLISGEVVHHTMLMRCAGNQSAVGHPDNA